MKEITVIGATSSLGINLVSLLAANGYKVYASYRTESRIPQEWREKASIIPQKLDLSGQPDFAEFCRPSVVWLAHLEQGRFNERELEVNLAPFEKFLAQASNSATEKFVFVSSGGSVYGEPHFLPITEEHPRNPLSSYGKAKLAMEDALFGSGAKTRLKTAIIRPGNIYGFEVPHRAGKGIIAAFLNAVQTETPFTLIHKGQTVRDFVHVADVSRAILTAIESPQNEIVWNVATEKGTTAVEVLEIILEKSGFEKPEINDIENFSSDVGANILSIGRITRESGWTPQISLEEGISRTIENWRHEFLKTSHE
ncbi:MAG TPA: NAD(P)-dependent oxidoreductase [Pyrinomonadaceae bacterium]|nr:NAD(P)-dependent oxidoreductase [Pyrinomonadaceae bacterium]